MVEAIDFDKLFEQNKLRCKKLNNGITGQDFFFKVVPKLVMHQDEFIIELLSHHDPLSLDCAACDKKETIVVKVTPVFKNKLLISYLFTEIHQFTQVDSL